MENGHKRSYEDAFESTIGSLAMQMAKLTVRNEALEAENKELKEKLKRHVVKPDQRNKHNLARQEWTYWKPTELLYLREVKALLVKRKSSYASFPEGGPMRAELADVRETECAICSEEFNRESIVVTHNCGHMFHLSCVNIQLMKLEPEDQLTCPTCRCPVR